MAGRDGFFFFRGGTGQGRLLFFSEAGRGGRFFFPKRDGAVVFFSEAGRGGCCFFPRRDGALYFFFEAGRDGVVVFFQRQDGRFFFSAGTGRLTAAVFSAGTVFYCLYACQAGGGNIL